MKTQQARELRVKACVTAKEHAKIMKAAKREKCSVSELIRFALENSNVL